MNKDDQPSGWLLAFMLFTIMVHTYMHTITQKEIKKQNEDIIQKIEQLNQNTKGEESEKGQD